MTQYVKVGTVPDAENPWKSSGGVEQWEPLIQQYATQYGVDPEIIRASMQIESGGNPNAISSKGAIGLMQLMPATARKYGLDPTLPKENIEAGARNWREALDWAKGDVGLAASYYQGGPDRSKWGPQNAAYRSQILAALRRTGEGIEAQPTQYVKVGKVSDEENPWLEGKPKPPKRSYFSDIPPAIMGGFAQIGRGAAWLMNAVTGGLVDKFAEQILGRGVQDMASDAAQAWLEKLTPETKASLAKKYLSDKEGEIFAEGITDPRKIFTEIIMNAPQVLLSLGPTGVLAMRSARAAGAAARKGALEFGLTAPAASEWGKQAAIQAGIKTGAKVGALTEAALGGPMQAAESREEVMAMPREKLLDTDFAREYQAEHPQATEAEIREAAATRAGLTTAPIAAAVDLLGAAGVGAVLGKAAGKAGGRALGALKVGTAELATEIPQSMGEQAATNIAVQKYGDPERELGHDVLESGVAGGIVGLGLGGATGAVFSGKAPSPEKRPLAAPRGGPGTLGAPAGYQPYVENGRPVPGVFIAPDGTIVTAEELFQRGGPGGPGTTPPPAAAPRAPATPAPGVPPAPPPGGVPPPVTPARPAPVVPPVPGAPGPGDLAAATNTAFTPSGIKVESFWAVVPARRIEVSHDITGTPNPEFNQKLQKRDLGSAAALTWVAEKIADFKPELLGETAQAGDGAPILSSEENKRGRREAETGRKRILMVRQIYAQHPDKADQYRAWLDQEAAKHGIDPASYAQMPNPMLVRVRTTPMTEEQRVAFARDADLPSVMAMGKKEQAKMDAEQITPEMMADFNPSDSGDFLAASNAKFVQAFIMNVVGAEGRAAMIDDKGKARPELADRMEAALFAKALPDEDFLDYALGTRDSDIKSIINALIYAAPRLQELGDVPKDLDIRPHLIAAANLIRNAKTAGQSPKEAIDQSSLIEERHFMVDHVARFFVENIRAPRQMGYYIAEIARYIADEVNLGRAGDMFGGRPLPSFEESIKRAQAALKERYGKQPVGTQAGIFAEPAGAAAGEAEAAYRVEKARQPVRGEALEPSRDEGGKQVSRPRAQVKEPGPRLGQEIGPEVAPIKPPEMERIARAKREGEKRAKTVRSDQEVTHEGKREPQAQERRRSAADRRRDLQQAAPHAAGERRISRRRAAQVPLEAPPVQEKPVEVETRRQEARQEVEPDPSAAQIEAGNYEKGHLSWQGERISIETAKGGMRRSKPGFTPAWEVKMPHDYGHVIGTIGADGEQVDITLGPNLDSGTVFVIDQKDLATDRFDEHKVMAGFDSQEQARAAYAAGFSDGRGRDRIQGVATMTVPEFKAWLDLRRRPAPLAPAGEPAQYTVEAQRDVYTQDLFGPLPIPQRVEPQREPAKPQLPRDVYTPAPLPGTEVEALYATRFEPERIETLNIGFSVIDTAEKAAHVFGESLRDPNERFNALVLDRNDRPIAYLKLFAGTIGEVSVAAEHVAKEVYQTPGAKSVWFAHQHPGGDPKPSAADVGLTRRLAQLFHPSLGVELKGHLVLGYQRASLLGFEGGLLRELDYPQAPRNLSIPIAARRMVAGESLGQSITRTDQAREAIKRIAGERSGVLFLDYQNRPRAFLPMTPEEMNKLRTWRTGTGAARLFDAAARSNAAGAITYIAPAPGLAREAFPYPLQNVGSALKLAGIKHLDAFVGEMSLASIGLPLESGSLQSIAQEISGAPAAPIQAQAVETRTQAIMDRLQARTRPPLVVVQHVYDLPERLRYYAHPKVRGIFDRLTGRIFMVADNLNENSVEPVLLHELVAHFGLRNLLGASLDPVLMQVYLSRAADIQREARSGFLRNYGFDFREEQQRLDAAEEYIAHLGDKGIDPTLWQRLVSTVRRLLRELGFVRTWSDADILDLLRRSRSALKQEAQVTVDGIPVSSFMQQIAWHGSPYTFERFSLHRIGTGEGAASYGWGLYFAGRKAIAEWYRGRLARGDIYATSFTKEGRTIAGDEALAEYFKPGRIVKSYGGGWDRVIRFTLGQQPALNWSVTVQAVRREGDTWVEDPQYPEPRIHYTHPGEKLTSVLTAEGWEVSRGRLYEVDLAPAEDEYLPWDKPVPLEQLAKIPELVRESLNQFLEQHTELSIEQLTGRELYQLMVREAYEAGGVTAAFVPGSLDMRPEEQVSRYLASVGIPGIKYLDASSRANWLIRGAGEVKQIADRWAIVKPSRGMGPEHTYFETEAQARAASRPYAEDTSTGNTSPRFETVEEVKTWIKRQEERATYNYVIFDDRLVTIRAMESIAPLYSIGPTAYGLREAFGMTAEGKIAGQAYRRGDTWTVRLLADTPIPSGGQVMQAGSLEEVRRLFNRAGLEFKAVKPRKQRTPQALMFGSVFQPRVYGRVRQYGDWFLRKFQDAMLPWKRIQEDIIEQGGIFDPATDFYKAEERWRSIAMAEIEEMRHIYIEPMTGILTAAGLSIADGGRFVAARHAPERNAQIARINPKNQAGSGMTDERARQIMAAFRAQGLTNLVWQNGDWVAEGAPGALDALAVIFDRLTAQQLQARVESGLSDEETRLRINGAYQYYAPLRDNYTQDEAGRRQTGLHKLKRAFGRTTEADAEFVIPFALAQTQVAVIDGERNQTKQALLRLIEANPNPELWTIDQIDWKPYIDKDTGEVEWTQDRFRRYDDNQVSVYVDGVEHIITINNPELARSAHLHAAAMPEWVAGFAWITRYLAMANTAASPEFVLSNFSRDIQMAGINVGGERGARLAAAMIKDIPKAMKGMWQFVRHQGPVPPEAPEWMKHAAAFAKGGGRTAYLGLTGVEESRQALLALLKDASPNAQRRAWMAIRGVGRLIMDVNAAVENAVRLSLYVNATKMGYSEADAVSMAKNVTVNFDRRGELGSAMTSFYMFFNASAQGAVRVAQAVYTSRKVQAVVLGAVLLAAWLDWLNRELAGEDREGRNLWDNVRDDVKERNIVIMRADGSGEHYMIPMPYGYSVFWVLGQTLSAILHGAQTPGKAAGRLFAAIMGSFNPLGDVEPSTSGIIQLLAPTVLDPLVQHGLNRNFFDGSIRPEQRPFGAPKPESELFWRNTPQIYVGLAREINEATGGNEARPGAVSISPNVMQHYWRSATGGAGEFWMRALNGIIAQFTDEEMAVRETPFLRRVFREPTDAELGKRFREKVSSIKVAREETLYFAKKAALEGTPEARARFEQARRDNMWEFAMHQEAERTDRRLADLRRAVRAIQTGPQIADKKERIKNIEETIANIQKDFNRRYTDRLRARDEGLAAAAR